MVVKYRMDQGFDKALFFKTVIVPTLKDKTDPLTSETV